MTEKELFNEFGIRISVFVDELFEDEAFYISGLKTMFISDAIPSHDRVKVTLHELGHQGHLPHLYQIFREKHEIQANRFMIHNLLKLTLSELESHADFNYLDFMEHYQLKTTAEEMLVKEEYKKLASGL